MFSWDDFYFLFPEIFLALNILMLLLLSIYHKVPSDKQEHQLVQFGLLVLIGTALLIGASPEKGVFFQGMLEINIIARFFKIGLLVSAICVFSIATIPWIFKMHFVFEYPLLLLLSLLGGLISLSAGDFLVLFLGLELQALPLYVLVAFDKGSPLAPEAGLKYFTLGALATGLFLFGISLIYGTLGTIQFQNFHNLLTMLTENGAGVSAFPVHFLVGLIFILGAMFFKLSLAPFHMWAPDVYEGATAPTVLFLASCVKIVSIFVLFKLFTGPFLIAKPFLENFLCIIAGSSMLVGALGGIFQEKFQRLLAYSGISHMGFLLSTLVVGNLMGLRALMLYLLIYIPMIILAFMLLMIFKKRAEATSLHLFEFKGLGKSAPLFAFFMAALMFSLAGVPPLGGFLGKFNVLIALMASGHTFLGVVAVLSSVVSCYYYLRIVKLMYFEKSAEEGASTIKTWDLSFQNRLILLTLLTFTLGFTAFGSLIPLSFE